MVSCGDNVHFINVDDSAKVLWSNFLEYIAIHLINHMFALSETHIEMDRVHYETYESENYYDSMERDSTVQKVT